MLSINAASIQSGQKSLKLLGMHYVTGSEAISYYYGKGKASALAALREDNFSSLYILFGGVQ